MTDTIQKESAVKVYEIGYLLVPSIPGEKVTEVVAHLKDVLAKKRAIMIAGEDPELRELAYDMVKKIGVVNHRFEKGYFGWMKFELSAGEIESVKKDFEMHPDMLRMLLIITIPENTYLGKKLPVSAEGPVTETLPLVAPLSGGEEKAPMAIASVEEMDKSIDEMVKEA